MDRASTTRDSNDDELMDGDKRKHTRGSTRLDSGAADRDIRGRRANQASPPTASARVGKEKRRDWRSTKMGRWMSKRADVRAEKQLSPVSEDKEQTDASSVDAMDTTLDDRTPKKEGNGKKRDGKVSGAEWWKDKRRAREKERATEGVLQRPSRSGPVPGAQKHRTRAAQADLVISEADPGQQAPHPSTASSTWRLFRSPYRKTPKRAR